MEDTIQKLQKVSEKSGERAQRNINNLISRIEFFTKHGNDEKLESCKAEAELWLRAA